jgi:hypothetical protein
MHRRLFAAPSPVPRRGRARRPYYSPLSLIGPARASGMSRRERCSVTLARRAIEPGAAWLQPRLVQKQCAIHSMCPHHAGIPLISTLFRGRSVRRHFANLFEWSVDTVSAAWRAWPLRSPRAIRLVLPRRHTALGHVTSRCRAGGLSRFDDRSQRGIPNPSSALADHTRLVRRLLSPGDMRYVPTAVAEAQVGPLHLGNRMRGCLPEG